MDLPQPEARSPADTKLASDETVYRTWMIWIQWAYQDRWIWYPVVHHRHRCVPSPGSWCSCHRKWINSLGPYHNDSILCEKRGINRAINALDPCSPDNCCWDKIVFVAFILPHCAPIPFDRRRPHTLFARFPRARSILLSLERARWTETWKVNFLPSLVDAPSYFFPPGSVETLQQKGSFYRRSYFRCCWYYAFIEARKVWSLFWMVEGGGLVRMSHCSKQNESNISPFGEWWRRLCLRLIRRQSEYRDTVVLKLTNKWK